MRPDSGLAQRAPLLLALVAASLAAGPYVTAREAIAVSAGIALATWAAGFGGPAAIVVLALVPAAVALGGIRSDALRSAPVRAGQLAPGAVAVVQETPRAERFGWRTVGKVRGADLLLRGSGARPGWQAGDVVRISGSVVPPGDGDGWLRTRRIVGKANIRPGQVVGHRGGFDGFVDRVRRRAAGALTYGLDTREASLLRGMVLGDDAEMGRALRTRVRRVGLGHVVAASGANVAILAALVLGACAVAGIGFRGRLAACAMAIVIYVPLCGSGPSIVRAAIGGLALLAATSASRPASRWHGLLLAAVLTLAYDPNAWKQVGWQLSYAAVLGIGLLAGPVRSWLARQGAAVWVAEGAAVTFAATAATAPVSAAAFGVLSPVSLPVNVIAAPLVVPATWLGMAASFVGQADVRLAAPLTLVARWPLAAMLTIVDVASPLPFAQLPAGVPTGVLVALLCAGISVAVAGPRWRVAGMAMMAVPVLAFAAWALLWPNPGPGLPPHGGTRISFLDVGQGDATLLQSRGRAMLVDAGPPGSGVLERLREAGVTRLDQLVVTHAQADHLGGAAQVLSSMPVGLLLDGRDEVDERFGREMAIAGSDRGVAAVRPRAGDRFSVGALSVEVLWPGGVRAPGSDPNLRCVVLRVTGEGSRLLLGADAESDVLGRLRPGPVDLLKVSHHGSGDQGLPGLLREVSPSLAVIEVGKENRYGHPSPSTLSALARSGARVLRTDRDGTVRVDLTPAGMRVHGRP